MAVGITAALHCADHNIHRELSLNLYFFVSISKFISFIFVFSKNSLKDSKKHNSRRSNKNNQQISIITSDSTAINAHPTQIQMQQQQQQQPHYDNRMNTQVKTYTDHGNGHSVMRTGNSSHYSKVRYFVCIN